MSDQPTRRDLLRDLTHEAIDNGSYGEPAPTSPGQGSALSERTRAWLDNPNGGGAFTGQADAIRAHSSTCSSLRDAWLPRRGGRTAFGDIAECQRCEITFFWEGLRTAFDECPYSNHWYCVCCRAAITTCGCTEGDQ